MAHQVVIHAGPVTMLAELNESPTAQRIWEALPIEARGNTWGDEIYFRIPVEMAEAEDARADMAVGELGYWPVGHAFCIFFGRTPASTGSKPRAASPVNPIGHVLGDATELRLVPDAAQVRISRSLK